MESIVVTWRELLLVLAAVLAVYVAEMLLLLRRGGNRGWRLWQRGAQANAQTRAIMELRAQIEALQHEVARLGGARAGLAPDAGVAPMPGVQEASVTAPPVRDPGTLTAAVPGSTTPRTAAVRIEPELTAASRASSAPALPPPLLADAATPYAQAIRMAREGRAVADMAIDCGISRGEAELIVALYRTPSPH
jgi:hypothetical protein